MNLKRDYFGRIPEPLYILTKPNGERIGTIKCTAKNMSISFNAPDEISFSTNIYIDGKKNQLYDQIMEGQFIEVVDYGRYVIISCETSSEGTKYETKSCNAISKEVLLGQKYLELFTINMGTTESIDNVQFYNLQNPERSLLHLILDKCPDWEIGHVDTSLITLHRCFEETRVDIYSFLTTTVADAFQCVFLFDSYHNRINIYSEDTVGTDTDIYVTYQNLLKNTSISSSLDDIKTCLTVTGADDLNIREVNMGYDKLYMLDYFVSKEYMSQGLYDAYNAWKSKWNNRLPTYTSLLSQYQKYYENINYETNLKMPSNPSSTTWSEYGLVPLQEKQATYEGNLAVMIKAGQGDPSHRDYNTMYLPCFNTIQDIKQQIIITKNTINRLNNEQNAIGIQMNSIISDIDMSNNFTNAQLKELSIFIREDELSSDNYIVTDNMTDSERMDMLYEMLEFGQKELRRISQPQYQFSANLINLYTIPEFDRNAELFNVGNYIHIILRDDYMVKARILQINVNFLDVNDFDVTFGTLSKLKGTNIFTDITQAINTATSVATTVSFNTSNWNRANKEVTEINDMLAGGLLAAGESLKTARSDVEIDDRGIIISNTPESIYKDDKIFIGDGKILFSNDGLKTIKTAIGHLTYTKKGVTYTDFGVLAQFLIAGYIAGSTIEGNEIIGGTITGSRFNNGNGTFSVDENGILSATKGRIGCDKNGNGGFIIDADKLFSGKDAISSSKSGVYLGTNGISLGENSTFKVDNLGNLNATSATITGNITANEGYIGGTNGFVIKAKKMYSGKTSISDGNAGVYIGTDGIALGANNVLKFESNGTFYAEKGYLGGIGGFALEKNKLYNGKSSISNMSNGIYLGTDGIALGANNVFKVTNGGILTTTSGHIGGANITSNSIRSDNGNWAIYSDGTATFKSVVITGDSSRLNIGGGFGMTGEALNNFNNLVADKVTANYIDATVGLSANYATITTLDVVTARVGILEADHVSVRTFEALTAIVGDISATYITAQRVRAEYMEVANWVSAGYIRADKIDVEELASTIINSRYFNTAVIKCNAINIDGGLSQTGEYIGIGGTSFSKKTANVMFSDGISRTITYLGN